MENALLIITRYASYLAKEKAHGVYLSQTYCKFLRRDAINLDDFIITCFCTIDEMLPAVTKGQRLRQRGPMPQLADSEVITMEVVGTYYVAFVQPLGAMPVDAYSLLFLQSARSSPLSPICSPDGLE
jgi:hypothetical protein